MFDVLWADVRLAARSLVKRPLVTLVAVMSLALGIGVNTAIFSVFERLLLRPLPVAAPEEIVHVTSPGPRPGFNSSSDGGGRAPIFSLPLFRDLERLDNTGLAAIAAHRDFAANVAWRGTTTRADGMLVSGGDFPMLGVAPALGRLDHARRGVVQRRAEFGPRMALGSQPRDILALVLRRAMTPVAIGLVAGIVASVGVTRLLQAMLFGIAPSDPLPLVVATTFLSGVALLAAAIPARRATRINPLETLRAD